MVIIRRKGAAIVETSKGILVVSGRSRRFILPGGGANKGESRKKAAIRELYEETGLKTKGVKYLLSYKGNVWHNFKGKQVVNHAKVFLIQAYGNPKPRHEIKHIAFWKPESQINITSGTKKILDRYLMNKSVH